jgi:hypothetical protein
LALERLLEERLHFSVEVAENNQVFALGGGAQ